MRDGDTRNQDEVAVSFLIEAGLEELGLAVSGLSQQKLVDLVFLLEHWASRINLTGHQGAEEIAARLILDAAALATALPEIQAARTLADLGSGAGFPGLPLAILHPGTSVRLVDSRLKRNHFQREVRRRLGLENVESILGRSDQVEQKPSDIVIAQAMTQPTQALGLMREWAHPDSILVLPASESAAEPVPPAGIATMERREYRVPGTGVRRQLWVARPVSA